MTRISESSINLKLLNDIVKNRVDVNRYSEEVSSGLKVQVPGDSKNSGTIAGMQDILVKAEQDRLRVSNAAGFLTHQDNALTEVNEILVRATEIAAQASNETNSENERFALAAEVYEIREHLISLANSTYQGRYIFSGGTDDTPAYHIDGGNAFTVPSPATQANTFYRYDTTSGSDESRDAQLTTDLKVTINKPGDQIFQNALEGLTQLGRSLEGYRTGYTALQVPDAAQSTAYNFPTDFNQQSTDIQSALDMIEAARNQDIVPERTQIAGKLRRLQTAESLLGLSVTSARKVLSDFQDADVIESATQLTEAQTALNASLTVTTQLLRQSILDFL